MSKGWIFHYEPVQTLVNLLNREFPDFEANIYYANLDNDALGATVFPADGGVPGIFIDLVKNKDFESILDILSHEAAHVIVGQSDDHSEKWQQTYDSINEKYVAWCEKEWK